MSHYAQYRHRGGHIQGFQFPAPLTTAFNVSISTTHVNVAIPGGGPGAGINFGRAETYLLSTPNVINEVFDVPVVGNATGTFVYSVGQAVGIRLAWPSLAGGFSSGWSGEKTLTF